MTTTPEALIRIFNRIAVTLRASGDYVEWSAPRGTMTDELLQVIKTYKPALLDLLKDMEKFE